LPKTTTFNEHLAPFAQQGTQEAHKTGASALCTGVSQVRTELDHAMRVPVGVKRRPPTPVLTRAPAWKGALLERTCSLQQRALVRSERVRSHLGKNLGSSAAELLRRERAHAKRTHKAEMGPPNSELRLLLPGNSWCRRRGKNASPTSKKATAYPLKTERMLGERIYLRGAICIFGTKMPRVFASNPGTVQANQGSTRSAKTVYTHPARTTTRTIPGKRLTEPSGWAV